MSVEHPDFVISAECPDSPDIRALIDALDALQLGMYPTESTHCVDVSTLMQPSVTFLVARRAGVAVGCGAVLALDGYGEMKRMFVAPAARGSGLGRALVAAIEAAALKRDLRTIRLETGIYQPEAIGLYESSGYERRGPYGAYTDDPLSIFMEKTLTPH